MGARILYSIYLGLLVCYSYVLVDPNVTFLNNAAWTSFREAVIQVGYYNRPLSWYIFVALVLIGFGFHFYFLKFSNRFRPLTIALITAVILMFSYPLTSHDFFNYMFDAKILTFYHQNPYAHKALDFPDDTWIRFMHWVHRPYPYGPAFLAITLVPSFLGLGKFIIHFFLLKAVFSAFYVMGVYCMSRINKTHALFLATQPLILWEGLVAGHNDLMALSLGIAGLYFLIENRGWTGRLMLLLSAAIKYTSAPYLLLMGKGKYSVYTNAIAFLGIIAMIGYFAVFREIQQWYFLNLLLFLPMYPGIVSRLQPLYLGLLLSYYPLIRVGEWETGSFWTSKEGIVMVFLAANIVYLAVIYAKPLLMRRSSQGGVSSSKAHTQART